MQIWTHRGNPGPENTIEAFGRAWEDGVRFFETDVHSTSDGVLVLSHDSNILRLTDIDREIRDLTLEELHTFKIENSFNWTTLDELCDGFPLATISIDLKSEDSVDPFLEWAKGRDLDRFVIGSFTTNSIRKVRRHYPRARTALTPVEVLLIAWGLGNLLPPHSGQRMAMVPTSFKGVKVLTRGFESFCQEKEIPIIVWTINTKVELTGLEGRRISGIVTDNYAEFI
jgi:glycerophosphoryl diester phosphodiesterase